VAASNRQLEKYMTTNDPTLWDVADAFGMNRDDCFSLKPCPCCGAEDDDAIIIGLFDLYTAEVHLRWRCETCGATGVALDLAAAHLGIKPEPDGSFKPRSRRQNKALAQKVRRLDGRRRTPGMPESMRLPPDDELNDVHSALIEIALGFLMPDPDLITLVAAEWTRRDRAGRLALLYAHLHHHRERIELLKAGGSWGDALFMPEGKGIWTADDGRSWLGTAGELPDIES